jgi:hypothetical protein
MASKISNTLPRLLLASLLCGHAAASVRGQSPTPHRWAVSRGSARRGPGAVGGRAAEIPASAIWPGEGRDERLSEVGRGKGIVFSPDLSVPTNRAFYERLGFAYFEDADWRQVLGQIRRHNLSHPMRRIEVLILETHGTNGNGLKLQAGHSALDARSYLSVGALQESLEGTGIRLCVITACNAGRLFRPQIYKRLNTHTGDPLFLPATRGIVNASPGFDPARGEVRVVYPSRSSLETTNEGDASELSPAAQNLLVTRDQTRQGAAMPAPRLRFVVSDILAQLLLRDSHLRLSAGGYVSEKSGENFSDGESEDLFQRFLDYLDGVARRELLKTGGGDSSKAYQ